MSLLLARRTLAWQLRHRWERAPIGMRFAITLSVVITLVFAPMIYVGIHALQKAVQAQRRMAQTRQAKRVEHIIERELLQLLRHNEDYSVWDDARKAVLQDNRAWIQTYLVDWLTQQFGNDIAFVLDTQNRVRASSSEEIQWLITTSLVQNAQRGVGGAGLIRHQDAIYLITATPICDEELRVPPVGVLVVGKRLNQALLSRIEEHLGSSVTPVQASSEQDIEDSSHYAVLRDAAGTPIMFLKIEALVAETLWASTLLSTAKRYLLGLAAIVALASSLTMVFFLRRYLAHFLVALNRLAGGDWATRVPYAARDEFGYLAQAFNKMASQLQQAFEEQERQRQQIQAQHEELHALYLQLQAANQELALLNAELTEANQALAQAAVTDSLTGLKNHRAFQEALHSLVQMAERLQQPLSLIMLDIDYFKQFNDSFGHPAGDDLLRQVAQALRDSARAYDVAARYGGEEFALLLPNTTLEQAAQVAERLRLAIRAIPNPHRAVSASLGVATYRFGTAPATLLYEADAALYHAKRNGRDRVCLYQSEAA